MINLLNTEKKDKINHYWGVLSNYQKYNEFFEEEISKNLKEAYFDYSIISLGILNKQNRKLYEEEKSKCNNLIKRSLYHGT